jgi:hypothetical protein
MPVYVKKSTGLDKMLKGSLVQDIRVDFNKQGPKEFRKAILADMNKSISPVKGKGKWVRYSKSYIKKIQGELGITWGKQVSPVNLKLSGELHNSLKVFGVGLLSKTYVLRIQFDDFLADIHNRRGAGRSKGAGLGVGSAGVVRRLLPTENGEDFNYGLTRVLLNSLKASVGRVVARFNT